MGWVGYRNLSLSDSLASLSLSTAHCTKHRKEKVRSFCPPKTPAYVFMSVYEGERFNVGAYVSVHVREWADGGVVQSVGDDKVGCVTEASVISNLATWQAYWEKIHKNIPLSIDVYCTHRVGKAWPTHKHTTHKAYQHVALLDWHFEEKHCKNVTSSDTAALAFTVGQYM